MTPGGVNSHRMGLVCVVSLNFPTVCAEVLTLMYSQFCLKVKKVGRGIFQVDVTCLTLPAFNYSGNKNRVRLCFLKGREKIKKVYNPLDSWGLGLLLSVEK